MNNLKFSIDIKADKETIWKALWDDERYRDWASVFFEGSFMVVDSWQAGNKVHFLGPDQSGIYSLIEKHTPNELIQFKHIGTVAEAKEQALDEETKKWTGATERYMLVEGDDTLKLSIESDVMDEHLEFMKKTFPLALEKIKNSCE